MKNTQRGFIIPLVIGIVVLMLAAGAGIYFYSRNKQNNQSVSIATTASTSTSLIEGFSKYTEPSVGMFELQYPTGWDVLATKATSTTIGGAEISPGKSAGILDPLITVQIDQVPGNPTNFSFTGQENALLSLVKNSGFILNDSKEMTLGGDRAFYVSYTAPSYGIHGIYINALATSTPNLNIVGGSAALNAPYLISLEYKSATSTYSQNIENALISTFKENIAATLNYASSSQIFYPSDPDSLSQKGWKNFISPDSLFEVYFPSLPPAYNWYEVSGHRQEAYVSTDVTTGNSYAISIVENTLVSNTMGGNQIQSVEQSVIDAFKKNQNYKVISSESGFADSYPVVDLDIIDSSKSVPLYLKARNILADGKVFALLSESVTKSNTDQNGFVDSFKILNNTGILNPSQSNTVISTSTAGWQVYNNPQYDISFKYPAGWEQPQFSDTGAYGLESKQLLFAKENLFITWDNTFNGQNQTITDYTDPLVYGGNTVSDSSFQKNTVTIDGTQYTTLISNNVIDGATTSDVSVFVPKDTSPDSVFVDLDYTTCTSSVDCRKVNVSHSEVDPATFYAIVRSVQFTR